MLKKVFFLCTILILIFCFAVFCSALDISSKHATLIECQSGDVVFSKDADSRAPMASTTKIMTAIVAIENADLQKLITVSDDAIGTEGSSIYLKSGERLTINDLLYALLLESANDAATAIAIEIGGSVENFSEMMNEKAHELGLLNTNFSNPHGLDDENHYTTANDLAKIALYAMQIPKFREIVSSKTAVISSNECSRTLVNHNKLLRFYDGAIGIKTGFTKKSGRCLVSCAQRDGVTLIAVTLDAPNDWNDHKRLLNYGFEQYESIHLASRGDYVLSLNCVNGQRPNVLCSNLDDLNITLKKGDKERIHAVFEAERFLFAPVEQGHRVGRIVYYLDGLEIASLDLFSLESVKSIKYKKSIFERIFD